MRVGFAETIVAFLLITIITSEDFLRIPLTKGYFYDLVLHIGTPRQEIVLGVTPMGNQLSIDCSGDPGSFDKKKSTSLSQVYCVSLSLSRILLILAVLMHAHKAGRNRIAR